MSANGTPPAGSPRVTSTDSHALLTQELTRTREALRELYRVFVFVDGPITAPSKQAAIREAAEVLGHR